MATAEFSKFAGILSAALSQHLWLVLDLPNNNSSSAKITPPRLVVHPSKLDLNSLPLMKHSFISVFLFVLFSFYVCVNASVHSTGPKSHTMGVWGNVGFGLSALTL